MTGVGRYERRACRNELGKEVVGRWGKEKEKCQPRALDPHAVVVPRKYGNSGHLGIWNKEPGKDLHRTRGLGLVNSFSRVIR